MTKHKFIRVSYGSSKPDFWECTRCLGRVSVSSHTKSKPKQRVWFAEQESLISFIDCDEALTYKLLND